MLFAYLLLFARITIVCRSRMRIHGRKGVSKESLKVNVLFLMRVRAMQKFFVPYTNNEPAAVEVNGHRLLILTSESDDLVHDLELLGGSEIREMDLSEDESEQSRVLADLAADINGGVVLAPPGISPRDMIENLAEELPWIH